VVANGRCLALGKAGKGLGLDWRGRITEGMEARQGGDGFGSVHDSLAHRGLVEEALRKQGTADLKQPAANTKRFVILRAVPSAA
jgi:hypothetical protein